MSLDTQLVHFSSQLVIIDPNNNMPQLNFKPLSESTDFQAQLQSSDSSTILVFNVFEVLPEADDAFLSYWREDAAIMKAQPGLLSIQFHEGTEGSNSYINIAHWESRAALSAAFRSDRFQQGLGRCPEGVVASPIVMKEVAVPGVCTT